MLKVCLQGEKDTPFKATFAVKKNQVHFGSESELILSIIKQVGDSEDIKEYDKKIK